MILDDVPTTDKSREAFKNGVSTASFADFLIKILVSRSLGKIWNLFNELEIVENMDLFAL